MLSACKSAHTVSSMMENAIVEIQNRSFAYNGHPILRDVNLRIRSGDFVAMIGPNGGGKTTLLKLMLGLLKPQQGTIRIMGEPPQKASHRIGYVPQDVHINGGFPITAMDVVLMGKLQPHKRLSLSSRRDRQEATQALAKMEMDEYADVKIGELSGGQMQRVFISRALVTHPSLLLLDEPTASIDTKGQADFFKLLKELNQEMTIFLVSHDLLAISTSVKSVACVNRNVHYHNQAEITADMLETMYPCTEDNVCPVELVAHGLPHRVLKEHDE
jgi:zinc transport system ATP-binding protein